MKKSAFALITALAVTLFAFEFAPDGPAIKLPSGFSVQLFADSVGIARHIVVTPQGNVYVKLGRPNKSGNGILLLEDTNHDGKADKTTGFGTYGGTGIVASSNFLYASSDEQIFRYPLDAKGIVTNTSGETVVTGLINRRQHSSKSITLDGKGNIYVNIGAYANACQEVDRTKGSKGRMPCPILDSAGGIWQFNAERLNQTYGSGKRYATGLRNVVGLDWNKQSDQLFVMQHGRDQLFVLYPELYDAKQSAELPSEAMYALKPGDDCGWPYIYYDQFQKKKILAPEYGGDGKKAGGEKAIDPIVAFPGHLAPNGLLFYTGTMFPERYRNGAFVAFHGSWNRAPEKQMGYFVAFVPFKDGKPSGEWEIFADNFAGVEELQPGKALHRPCGLAQGPDGSLYVTDDVKGAIYKITYGK